MKRGFRFALLLVGAACAGLIVSEAVYRSSGGKDMVERLCRQSRDFAASYGIGLHGNDEGLDDVLIAKNLRTVSGSEAIGEAEIESEWNLLRDQFADERTFAVALKDSELTSKSLHDELAENLQGRAWIEKQIGPSIVVSEKEVQAFRDANQARFMQPQRYRASHIFLAAPDGAAAEVLAAKQSAIQGLAVRLLAGENFAQLAAEASEDEATKSRGGDLGYFSASRMPPEFFAEVEKLRPGGLSSPIRSHLGFHLVQLTDAKPPRALNEEETRPEIALGVANAKRAEAVTRLRESLR